MKTPFKIEIAGKELAILHNRLSETRWPDEIDGSGWTYGADLSFMKSLCDHWQNSFDWRRQEAHLNSLDHFRSEIDGFGLHYIYEKGQGQKSMPLLLTHGFPDSFVRFLKVIPLLTAADDNGFSFDVVIPSIPGFGFSEKASRPGMNPQKIAGLFKKLMTDELGYQKFAAHGGDWGSTITEQLAYNYPDSLTGIHLTDMPYHHMFTVKADDLTEAEKKYLEAGQQWQMTEGGYAIEQSTKPQTLAYGLNDSPAGVAAWIIEKFHSWSDNNGNLESSFTKEELLTNVSLYWFTETIHSACRIYYESSHQQNKNSGEKNTVPAAMAIFPKDMIPAPKEFVQRFYNLQQWTEMPAGGHFAAMEEPELLARDIRNFLSKQ